MMMSDRKLFEEYCFEELKAIRDEMLGSFWNPVMREHIDRLQELIWDVGERIGEFDLGE